MVDIVDPFKTPDTAAPTLQRPRASAAIVDPFAAPARPDAIATFDQARNPVPVASAPSDSFLSDVGRGIGQAAVGTARTGTLAAAGALEAATLGNAPTALTDPLFAAADKLRDYQGTIKRPDSIKGRVGEAVGGLIGGLPTLGIGNLSEGQDVIANGGTIPDALKRTALNAAGDIGGVALGALGGATRGARVARQAVGNAAFGEVSRVASNAISAPDQQRAFDPLDLAINTGAGIGFGLMPHGAPTRAVPHPDAVPGSLSDAANALPETAAPPRPDAAAPAATTLQNPQGVLGRVANASVARRAAQGATLEAPPVTDVAGAGSQAQSAPDGATVLPADVAGARAAPLVAENEAPPAAPSDGSDVGPIAQAQEASAAPQPSNPYADVPWINHETGEIRAPTDVEVKDQFHALFDQASSEGLGLGITAARAEMARDWGVDRKRLIELRKEALQERKDGITPDTRADEEVQRSAAVTVDDDAQRAALDETLKPSQRQPQAEPVDSASPPQETETPAVDPSADRPVADVGAAETPVAARGLAQDDETQLTAKPAGLIARDRAGATLDDLVKAKESGQTKAFLPKRANDDMGTAAGHAYIQQHGEFNFGTEKQAANYAAALERGEGGAWKAEQVAPDNWRAVRQAENSVDAAARDSAAHPDNERPEPTPAQHEANNYKQGHVDLHGLDVTIQVPKGAMRRGTDRTGKAWERPASDHYGHIRGTDGGDGEPHDVYLGPHAEDPDAKVFVIRQVKPGTDTFDESKAMIGYKTGREARKSYDANFPKGLKVFGGIQQMSLDDFKRSIGKSASNETRLPGDGTKYDVLLDADGLARVMMQTPNGSRIPVGGRFDGAESAIAFVKQHNAERMAAKARAAEPLPAQQKGERRTKAQLAQAAKEQAAREQTANGTKSSGDVQSYAEAALRERLIHESNYASKVTGFMRIARDETARAIAAGEDKKGNLKTNLIELEKNLLRAIEDERNKHQALAAHVAGAGEAARPEGVEPGEGDAEKTRAARLNDMADRLFANVGNEIGWEQHGGRILRGAEKPNDGALPDGVGRTSWVGKPGPLGESNLWRMRPDKINERQAHKALERAAAGHKLTTREQRFVDYARESARKDAEFQMQADELDAEQTRQVTPARNGDLLPAPTAREVVDAASRARDDERNGKTGTGRTDMLSGDGELFAGRRPEQTTVPDAAAKPVPATDAPKEITDVGEKIGGARKDMWTARNMSAADLTDLNDRELTTFVKKDAVFKRPDYAKITADSSREVAHAIKTIYDAIPNPGNSLSRAQFKTYVEVVGRLRDALDGVKKAADVPKLMQKAFGDDIMTDTGYMRRFNREAPGFPAAQLFGNKLLRALQYSDSDARNTARFLQKNPAWPGKTERAAEEGQKRLTPQRPEKLGEVVRTGNDYRNGKDVSADDFRSAFGFRAVEFGNWTGQGDRQASINHAYDAMHDLADALGVPPKAVSLDGQLGMAFGARGKGAAAAHYEPARAVINLTKTSGAGSAAHEWAHAVDDYFGKLSKDAGLRGADWSVTDRALQHGNIAGDLRPELKSAIVDVMSAINTRARTVDEAAKKTLGEAEKAEKNARWSAKMLEELFTAAKADPRTAGLLDAALASGRAGDEFDALKRHLDVVDPRAARSPQLKQVGTSLERADLLQRRLADVLNKPTPKLLGKVPTDFIAKSKDLGPYWARPHELFARSFETFIKDKIDSGGGRSDYLVHPAKTDSGRTNPRYPYPAGGERKTINSAFQRFVDTLQHKETENGNVALFDKPQGRAELDTASDAHTSAIDAAARAAAQTWGPNAPHLRVIGSAEDLPRSAKTDPDYRSARGFYDPKTGTAYVVAENVRDVREAMQTVAHEVIGHHGVEHILDEHVPGGWKTLVADIRNLREIGNGSDAMRGVLADVDRRYGSESETQKAKETLAIMAERGIRNGLIGRVVSAVRAFLRKLFPSIKFGDADLRRMLQQSERYVRTDKAADGYTAPVHAMSFDSKADPFYSALSESVVKAKGAPRSADAAAWKQWLDGSQRRGEFKAAEREWLGLDQFLDDQKGKVTREQLQQFVRDNQVRLDEKRLDGEPRWVVTDGDEKHVFRSEKEANDAAESWRKNLTDAIDSKHDAVKSADGTWRVETPYGHVVLDDLTSNRAATAEAERLTQEHRQNLHESIEVKQDVDTADQAKFGNYTLPGGENYREMLLRLPHSTDDPKLSQLTDAYRTSVEALARARETYASARPGARDDAAMRAASQEMNAAKSKLDSHASTNRAFTSSHFDQPNILAHVRLNDRTGPNGEKILHVEEVQSDWHQAGRRHGYALSDAETKELASLKKVPSKKATEAQKQRFKTLSSREPGGTNHVPDAPLKKEWPMLAMKRVLREAAEKGYDKVTWTTGEQQAARYDLRKQISRIEYMKDEDGTYSLGIYGKNGEAVDGLEKDYKPEELPDVIGKDAAEKIISNEGREPGEPEGYGNLTGVNLAVGGEGMKAFYDKMLPNEVNNYVKQWGGRVGESYLGVDKNNRLLANDSAQHAAAIGAAPLHSIDITPAMRDSVLQGQPLFNRGESKPFAEQVRERLASGSTRGPALQMGRTPAVLRMLGYADHPLVMPPNVLAKLATGKAGERPPLTERKIARLPEHLDDPLAVLRSATTADSLVVVTRMKDREGGQVIASVKMDATGAGNPELHVNVLTSAYGKAADWLSRQHQEGRVLFDANGGEAPGSRVSSGGALNRAAEPGFQRPANIVRTPDDLRNFRQQERDRALGAGGEASARDDSGGSFSKPAASMDSLDHVLSKPDPSVLDRAKEWLRGKAEDFRPAALGALQRRQLTELMADHPALKTIGKQYDERVQLLESDRNQLMTGAVDAAEHPTNMIKRGGAVIAEDLRKFTYEKGPAGWFGRRKPEAKALFDVMHDATLYGLDPSEAYARLQFEDSRGNGVEWSKQGIKERIAAIRGQIKGRAGDDKSPFYDEIKRLRGLPAREKLREQRYPELVARFNALPEQAKTLYRQQRDWHNQHRDEMEKALINRIESIGNEIGKNYTRSVQDRIRLQFEEQRRDGVYFPLNRDGDYWVSFTDKKGEAGFKMFESAKDAANAERKLREAGFTIDAQGRRDGNYKAKDAPKGTFVRDVVQLLAKSGAPEKVQDEIYQMFLKSLPEMSMRKHSIHRKGIPGYSDDALRAFAKNAFHGAHQLARLRHAHELTGIIEAGEHIMDNYRRSDEVGKSSASNTLDVARGDALLGELRRRHDYIMAPTDSQLANKANAVGFLYYLGASPASALVNLTQNAQVTMPVLGAHHGWTKAAPVMAAALRDSMRTFGNIDRTLTNPEERMAYNVLRSRGDIDKTQSHTLAGLAEGSLLNTNPVWSKAMAGMSYMFHKAEVVNREAAGMASYRLARTRGDSFADAVQYASDIINGTHFDYSASNRPRIMQGNAARVALQFKNYSVGMTWMLYRNLYQAFKAESPEVRAVARKTLTGIMGTTALMAGTMGLPVINAVKLAANAGHTLFGDDEPFDFDTEYRQWLSENLGENAGRIVADGAVNPLGANFSRRVSLSNLWFQDADKELEGKDAYYQLLESLAGPLGGMTKNLYVGQQMIGDGNVQRGIETMMPKFAKDGMKATRFAHDGANTLRGDPIVPDVTGPEAFIQALGFQPTRIFEQQKTNSALKNYEQSILDRRQSLMNAYAMAVRSGDDRDVAMEKIHAFNVQYPEIALKAESIRQSLRARARYSQNAEGGVAINKKLAPRLREMTGMQQAQ